MCIAQCAIHKMILVLQCQVVVGAALNTRPGSPSRLIVLAARVIILIIISTVGDEIKTQGQFCQDNSHAKVEV